jgi:tRNA (guanine-N7-)-methyltransferase
MVDLAAGPRADAEPIRTYKKRVSRITLGQREAIDRLGARFGVDLGESDDRGPLDLAALFGRVAPVVLEIGFGMGEATAEMAAVEPEHDLLAIDVHTPGVGTLLRRLEAVGLTNVRVAEGDARELLRERLAPASLHGVRVFFPDPWPKRRHAKRRLVTPEFADLVASRLVPGGRLHVATDWAPYAEQVRAVITEHPAFDLDDVAPWRPVTRFEELGATAGRPSHDVAASRR